MLHAADVEATRAPFEMSARDTSPREHQWHMFDQHGNKHWLEGRGTPEELRCGAMRWLNLVFDITTRIEAEISVANATDRLTVALEAIPDGFALFGENEINLSPATSPFDKSSEKSKTTRVKDASFESTLRAGLTIGQLRIPPGEESVWLASRRVNFRRAQVVKEVELHDGKSLRFIERPTSSDGRVSLSTDFSGTKHRQEELENAALTDALTGLLTVVN